MPQNFHLALERISGFNKIEYTSKTYDIEIGEVGWSC